MSTKNPAAIPPEKKTGWELALANKTRPADLKAKPYRVVRIFEDNGRGMHGWSSAVVSVADRQVAIDIMDEPMPAGYHTVEVNVARNVDQWREKGRWERVARRSRRGKKTRKIYDEAPTRSRRYTVRPCDTGADHGQPDGETVRRWDVYDRQTKTVVESEIRTRRQARDIAAKMERTPQK